MSNLLERNLLRARRQFEQLLPPGSDAVPGGQLLDLARRPILAAALLNINMQVCVRQLWNEHRPAHAGSCARPTRFSGGVL